MMSLMELEWRYHHLAMLYYRNHHYKKFHDYWGRYWATRATIGILFPWQHGKYDPISWNIRQLNRLMDEQDEELLQSVR